MFKIKVRALPKDLPEIITLDVSHLEIGQAIHLGDIKLPPGGVEILGDKHISVIAVAAPMTEAQEIAGCGSRGRGRRGRSVEMIKEKEGRGRGSSAARPQPAKGGDKAAPAAKAGDKAAPAAKGAEKPAEKKAEKKK